MDSSLLERDGRGGPAAARGTMVGVRSEAAPAGGAKRGPPRRDVMWLAGLLAMALVFASGQRSPAAVAVAVLIVTSLFALVLAPGAEPGGLSVTALLPAGFVLTCASALAVGLVGGVGGVSVWSNGGASTWALLVLILLVGVGALARGGRVTVVGRDAPAAVALVGALGFFTWVVGSQPFAWWSRAAGSGTDFLRHLGMIRSVRESGQIELGASAYPSSFHAVSAWFTSVQGTAVDAGSLWRAVQPLAFLMLGLMLMAVVCVATRLTHVLLGSWRAGSWAGAIAAIAFLQTAWFSTFLGYGNVMNMVVGVCLLALLVSGLGRDAFSSASGAMVCAGALAVTANAWPLLLPVAGMGALPWIAGFLGGGYRRPVMWSVWVTGAALSIHGLLAVGGPARIALAQVVTLSNLFRPDWWWWVALIISFAVIAGAWRQERFGVAMSSLGLVVGGIGLTAYLMHTSGSTWELMRYYPVKAMWTSIVVLIPLSSAGAVSLVLAGWRLAGTRAPLASGVLRGTVVLIVGIGCIGVAGRGSAFSPHLADIASGRAGIPNWSMAVIDSLEGVDLATAAEGTLVFGIVPTATVSDVKSGFVGMVDYMAMESLNHLGVEGAFDAPVKPALVSRDMTQVCRYLMDHPNSLRITGPNPASGPEWILDSGCPEAVVKPETWIRLQFDPVWLDNSPWQTLDWTFPTPGELEGVVAQG